MHVCQEFIWGEIEGWMVGAVNCRRGPGQRLAKTDPEAGKDELYQYPIRAIAKSVFENVDIDARGRLRRVKPAPRGR